MTGIFDNSLPSTTLKDFMKNFSYNGFKHSDLDRRGNANNRFTSGPILTPDEIKDASKEQNLYRDRFGRYNSKNKPGTSWFESYKEGLTKSYNGAYRENYSRDENSTNSYSRTNTDIMRYNTHRPENIHYNQRPISRNDISGSNATTVNDNLGELVSNFDREIDRTKPSDIYKKVDAAIELAEKLEKSQASSETQIANLENLIEVFDLMDKLIEGDIANLQATRNADKSNRGKNTGLQTSTELNAVDGMMARTREKAELSSKKAELNEKLVTKKVFNR